MKVLIQLVLIVDLGETGQRLHRLDRVDGAVPARAERGNHRPIPRIVTHEDDVDLLALTSFRMKRSPYPTYKRFGKIALRSQLVACCKSALFADLIQSNVRRSDGTNTT